MHRPKTRGFNKLAPFLQSQKCFAGSYFARARERGATVKSGIRLAFCDYVLDGGPGYRGSFGYSLQAETTNRARLEGIKGIDGWHAAVSQPARPQEEAKKRIA